MQPKRKYAVLFSALPPDTVYDQRLTVTHYRVLTLISMHDRMSLEKGGNGCFLHRDKMSNQLNLGLTTISDTINDLIAWSYLVMERHPDYANLVTYKVRFSHEDKSASAVDNSAGARRAQRRSMR
jgi:hypothetical protein